MNDGNLKENNKMTRIEEEETYRVRNSEHFKNMKMYLLRAATAADKKATFDMNYLYQIYELIDALCGVASNKTHTKKEEVSKEECCNLLISDLIEEGFFMHYGENEFIRNPDIEIQWTYGTEKNGENQESR